VREHQFVFVVGEWIVEPGFDHRLCGFRRVAGGIDPHAGFPQSEVAQDAFDHGRFVDEGHNSHFVLAVGADQRVGFPDFLDELAPLFGRNPAGLERGNVDDIALGRIHDFGIRLLEPLAAHLVGIPSVIAHELEAFVRDVLGDAGDEVARAEHFKIALDLRVHPRAVNDRVPGAVGLHFIDRERVADDVLGEPLHVLAVTGRHALAAVDVEPGVRPSAQHPGAFRRQEFLFHQKRDAPCAEEFLQRSKAHVGHHMEKPAVHKEPVGGQRVEVRVEVEVFAEGVDGHDDAGRALGQAERGALELGQAAVGDAAEFLDEPAMEPEVGPQHLGDRERQVPVRHRREGNLGVRL